MSFTRGGPNKQKQFEWHYDPETCQLIILNQDGRELMFSREEIQEILITISLNFMLGNFPLSSPIIHPGEGEGKSSLGEIIFEQFPGDFNRAQGASYLGVVLEECGYLEWNGRHVGIEWHLVCSGFSVETISKHLSFQ